MVRAYVLVERLFEHGLLTPASRLLVVGAGAGGVTAGLHAAHRGANVSIVEKESLPFFVQRDVSSRWICPTQYDWPMDHWERAIFPIDESELPLDWRAAPASSTATDWTNQLETAKRDFRPRLRILTSTECRNLNESDNAVVAEFKDSSTERTESFEFDIVLLCYGFAKETTTIASYTGPEFWRKGLPVWNGSESTVLIVGGGDGALQDFLLTTTGLKSARGIFQRIFQPGQRLGIEHEIHCAEDQAQRAALWADKLHDHEIFSQLESVHQNLVERILREETQIPHNVNALLDAGNRRAVIVHPCSHFSRVYALNRFLVLLILEVLERSGIRARRSGFRAEGIRPADEESHKCNKDEYCYAFPHNVDLQPMSCLGPSNEKPETGRFDRIIVRTGPRGAPRPSRQSLPYHLYPVAKLEGNAE